MFTLVVILLLVVMAIFCQPSIIVQEHCNGTKKLVDLSTTDYGRSVTVDSSDNIYVGGVSTGGGVKVYDSYLVKYNSSGTYQWQKASGN